MGKRGPKPGTPQRGGYKPGWNKKSFEDRLIQIPISVKGRFIKKTTKEIKEIIKKYR